ncbi:MAG TPA: glycogen/starch synthase [Myxococcota bacterium]|jgi:starch synthase|nr:glycogen/starch synthase [Myxococcota bacterium]
MKLLFAAAESAPLAQTGGLGDAVGGLARALGERGHSVTCCLPGYRSAWAAYERISAARGWPALEPAAEMRLTLPDRALAGTWWRATVSPGVAFELLELPLLYDRPGLYGFPDDALRFVAFARAAAHRAEVLRPDALVAHDWHAALAIALLRTSLDRGANRGIAGVQVVHNNAYQGRCPASLLPATGLAPELYHPDGVEAWGELCLLKAGIGWADRIVAVSPTYAREIQTAEFGEGLEGVYRSRAHRLSGIANGIDVERFDPARDDALPARYDAEKPEGKAACRRLVLAELGLAEPAPGRFLVAIGRLAAQKGWDVLADAVDGLVERGAALALLGDGEPALAARLRAAAARHPHHVVLRTGFDDALARRLYGGGDAVLVPSRFEPCGLVQRIAQRYGTLPVAHRVGGLADTIHDPGPKTAPRTPARRRMTGVLFSPLDAEHLVEAAERVATLGARSELEDVQERLLRLDVSWRAPSADWEAVLVRACDEARARL